MKTDSHNSKLTWYRRLQSVAMFSALFCAPALAQQTSWQDTISRLANYYDKQSKQPPSPTFHPPTDEPSGFLSRFPAGEELIFTVNAAGYNRGEIFAISSEQGMKVGLAELSALLNFNIEVSADNTSASGWFFHTSNEFSLQQSEDEQLIITSGDSSLTVTPSDYLIDGDILLEVGVITEALGLTFEADESRLVLYVSSPRMFAFESAEARRNRLAGGRFSRAPSVLPQKDNGYSLYTPPLFDAQLSVRTTDTSTFSGYSIASNQDLAYANTQLYLAGDDEDSLREARITLSRDSQKADVLGLPLTYAAIGDVLPVNTGIGQTASFGRGLALSNVKTDLADNRLVNFSGVIQAGWDVELYRNGILVANTLDIQEGRYEFTDIELLFGNNDFELVFYGPQGQIQREEKSYVVDSNSLKQGQSSFRFSAVDSNETVLGIRKVTDDPEQKGITAGFVYDRGLSDWYTLGVGGTYFSPDEGETFSTVSLRNNISMGTLGLLNSVVQLNSEQQKNYLVSYRSRFWNNSLSVLWKKDESVTSSELDDTLQFEDQAQTISLTFNGRVNDTFWAPVDYESTWSRSWDNQQSESESFRQSLSTNTAVGGLNYSFLGVRSNTLSENSDWTYESELGYRNRFGRVFTRLYTTYTHSPDTTFDSVGATISYPFSNQLSSEFRYSYSAITDNASYNARLNWFGDKVTVSSYANYSDDDQWSISLLARFGIGLNADKESFTLSPRPISTAGALAVRLYEDQNMNNEYDDNEPLLDGVTVNAAQVSRSATTEDGMAFIERLPKNRRTDIVIDESTLPDFTYTRTDEGFSVTGRPGLLQFADIPVVRSGELDGTVYLSGSNGEERALAFVNLQLVNASGETVATTKSEYDGFYLFEKILPGSYKVLVDPRDLQRQNAAIDVANSLDVSTRGDVFTNVDVVLRELTKTSGYMAQINTFTSLPLLKVYFSLINKRLPKGTFKDAFYLTSSSENSYSLSLGFSDDKAAIEQLCKQIQHHDVDCNVVSVELGQ
ncbi:hypothetical protein GTH32_11040 [Alteromonas sp. 345S023]|uniref:Carboxypeptidase regulatory-like domain-containing protein n=1 Tax=Alteromonas profundi TaxID=2696062 RepID=A0A7X5LLW0_9ALTE|nr:hypothetical protein [Alteromonas profundi]NDV91719.1 hypothetical protein [Alteromonas profundi]